MMNYLNKASLILLLVTSVFLVLTTQTAESQQTRWMNAGSLHNWYSEIHSEREHGLRQEQQFGLRWPAIFQYQDSQAYKGWWIGVGSFDDGVRDPYTPRVIHAGPRVTGEDYFEASEFNLVSRIPQPEVLVDGLPSFLESVEPDEVDPDMPADLMISNTIETAMGIEVERNIYQFSQEFHDNYHIMEYTYTNRTGETGETGIFDDIPEQTLEDAYFFHIFRYSPVRKTRYMVGNASGWGINTMIDRVGDGIDGEVGDPMRAQFAWHGYFPDRDVDYDNIGAPMIEPNTVGGYMSEADSTGRLGAYQFPGFATIHADESPDNPADDPAQPSTQSYVHSDDDRTSGNDPFNRAEMQREYNLMAEGIGSRHAWDVESDGDFANQRSAPNMGASGGYSATKGYGPYTLEPGESVRIVWVEGVSGLSEEKAEEVGRAFKAYFEDTGDDQYENIDGEVVTIDEEEKNRWVLTGRDSLLQTFERAIANYESDFDIPAPPDPPSMVEVNSGGDAIFLEWSYDGDISDVSHFEIYRAESSFDSTHTKIHRAEPDERAFEDPEPVRGRDYYYYITAVGFEEDNTGDVMTPDDVALRSSRYYTQSYDPTRLQRAPGEAMEQIAIAPNPYVRTNETELSLADRDEVAFFDVPGEADIRIYTELGEHVRTIEHRDGSGDAFWDLQTESRQMVASGIYLVVFENLETGESITRKLVVIY